jgi:hypothetical protein
MPAPKGLRLSPAQKSALWPMLEEAWASHVCNNQVADKSSAAKEAWRKQYLGETLGVWSLKMIPTGGPLFAKVMGKLQEVARNGIDWIIKADQSSNSELLYHARAVLSEHDIPETYACGVARNACKLATLPTLEDLTPPQLGLVIKIVYGQAPRIAKAAKASRDQQPAEPLPF